MLRYDLWRVTCPKCDKLHTPETCDRRCSNCSSRLEMELYVDYEGHGSYVLACSRSCGESPYHSIKCDCGATIHLEREWVKTVYTRSHGIVATAGRYGMFGAGGSAVLAVLIKSASDRPLDSHGRPVTDGEWVGGTIEFVLIFAIVGALIGAVVGALIAANTEVQQGKL